MRKLVLICLILISSVLFQIPIAKAVEPLGCPDTWKVDTSNYPNNPELVNAQNTLGKDMVLTVLETQFLTGEGELGAIPKLNWSTPPKGTNFYSMSYLYGKSLASTSVKVEVRGCSNPKVFSFSYKYFGDNTFSEITALQFSQANPSIFVDFRKQESFPITYAKYVENLRSMVKAKSATRNISQILLIPPFVGDLGLDVNRFSDRVFLVPTNSNCVNQFRIPNTLELIQGGVCEFAVGVFQVSKMREITILGRFELDSTRPKSLTILCVKGNLTKKITAIRPVCPSGYKKK
jgi:hypothetical protein